MYFFYFGVELPEDGANEAETYSSITKLYFFLPNVHSLVIRVNNLVEIHGIYFVKIPAVGFSSGWSQPRSYKMLAPFLRTHKRRFSF
jgi:hypothetical protein